MTQETLPDLGRRQELLKDFILSISGWRKVFSPDLDENGLGPLPLPECLALAATVGLACGDFFLQAGHKCLALDRDTRPTGAALGAATLRGLEARGLQVFDLGVAALPEFLAWVKYRPDIGGFVYISASHNPPGHNGWKVGMGDGSVLSAHEAPRLANMFRSLWATNTGLESQWPALLATRPSPPTSVDPGEVKDAYRKSLLQGAAGADDPELFSSQLKGAYPAGSPRLLCDFNGSARATALDGELLGELGVTLERWQDKPGVFAHRIVPEGLSLEPLRARMAEAWQGGQGPLWGWVPDCDGDRGNLVLALEEKGAVVCRAPDAQTTFALSVLSALASATWNGGGAKKLAIVANDPTSLRVTLLCRAFGATFAQAEVGEANVIARAAELAAQGFHVPLFGEGSNGGNITPPGTVRDPMATQLALLKLLFLKKEEGPSLFAHALGRLGLSPMADAEPVPRRLAHLLTFQLAFQSTSAFDSDALVKLKSTRQDTLKGHYERFFQQDMKAAAVPCLVSRGLGRYRILNHEGTRILEGAGNRSGDHSGGWKADFQNEAGEVKAFVWMRGSRTEPIFRVMAEVEGDKAFEQELLAWHRGLLKRADDLSA